MKDFGRRPDSEETSYESARRKSYIAEHYAQTWLQLAPKYGISPYHQWVITLLSQVKELVVPSQVLDCAAGTGYPFSLGFSRRGWYLYTVDLSEILVRSQVQRFLEERVPARCVVGDSELLPFADSIFGLTYCLQATSYFPQLRDALREMGRVTSPRGVLVFDIMNVLCPSIGISHSLGPLRCALRNAAWVVSARQRARRVVVEKAASPFPVERALVGSGWDFARLIPPFLPSLAEGRGRVRSRYFLFSPRLVYVSLRAGNADGNTWLQGIRLD